MPYKIHKSGSGFKVRSIHGTYLSKKPLTKAKALAQMQAVEIHEKLKRAK